MKRVMIVAGEASGDLHAAKLVSCVRQKNSNITFFGIGGQGMAEAGVDIMVNSADIAVVGLFEVLAHRKVIFAALNKMRELLKSQKPDLLLLVDYPDFNLRLAKTAKQCGVKVLFYISPQVWAWRQGRVKKIRQRVDMMAVVFPFEETFYRKHHVPCRYVGHPLTDEVHASDTADNLRQQFGLALDRPTVGLFPGSRKSEVKRLFNIILDAAVKLQQRYPKIQFLLPIASTLDKTFISSYLENYPTLDIKLIEGRNHDVTAACDAIVTVSGTVTLEIAILGTPMVIINKLSTLSYYIVRQLIKISHIGLCNIIADERIVPELIQNLATASNIANEISNIIDDPQHAQIMRDKLKKMVALLDARPTKSDICDLTLEMLNN